MSRDTATAANKNRRIRQEALREQLANQKHEEHVVEILNKVADESNEIDSHMLARYKVVLDTKMALIRKYIPDIKSTELTSGDDNGLFHLIVKK